MFGVALIFLASDRAQNIYFRCLMGISRATSTTLQASLSLSVSRMTHRIEISILCLVSPFVRMKMSVLVDFCAE